MAYTTAQAARLSACTVSQLRYWARSDLIVPSADGLYTFRDLVALRVVRSLLHSGLPTTRVRASVAALRAAGEDNLARLRLVTDGVQVWACYDDGQILDALRHGQLALFLAVHRVAGEVETDVATFHAERAAFVDALVQRG